MKRSEFIEVMDRAIDRYETRYAGKTCVCISGWAVDSTPKTEQIATYYAKSMGVDFQTCFSTRYGSEDAALARPIALLLFKEYMLSEKEYVNL